MTPTHLTDDGHEVVNPALPHEHFAETVRASRSRVRQAPAAVVAGSSRGGAVAMNINSGDAKLVLLCPAWKKYGTARTMKPHTGPRDETEPLKQQACVYNRVGPYLAVGGFDRIAPSQAIPAAGAARMRDDGSDWRRE